MSPTDSGQFTILVTATLTAEPVIALRPEEVSGWVLDDEAKEPPSATDPRPSRLVTSAASPWLGFRRHPFDDPCTYLG